MRTDLTLLGGIFLIVSITGWLAVLVSPALGCALIIVSPILLILGLILLIVGLATDSTPAASYPTMGYATPAGYDPATGYAPAAPPMGPAYPCHVCGRPLTFVPEYGRWYCHTCTAYR